MNWRDVIPETDLQIYEAAGYGRRSTLGPRPALLIIDVTYGFVGREPMPIIDSIASYPNSCGQAGWDAIGPIESVLGAGRAGNDAVYFTAGIEEYVIDHAGQWRQKHPRTLEQPEDAQDIVARIAPLPGEMLIRKTKPSAFHGTPLLSSLIDRKIDTLVIMGCTTSGCVRATTIDSFSYGFSTVVVEDGVFDRGSLSHAVNLFDMDQKYANVVNSAAVVEYLEALAPPR